VSNILDAVQPAVRIGGTDRTDMTCLQIEETSGIDPSKCLLRYVPGRSVSGPVALSNHGTPNYKPGQRVVVYDSSSSTIYFHGWLCTRQDDIHADVIHWTALGDQWMLQYIPIRGCLVRGQDGSVALSTRHINRVNPSGLWNCTGATIGGVVYPVFAPTAYRYLAYTSPTETFDGTTLADDGSYTAWTPRRYLQYLQLLATIYDQNGSAWPDGMGLTRDSSLDTAGALTWTKSSVDGMIGYDPAVGGNDPLDRKLPDMTFNGDTLLGGIRKTLDASGTHEMTILYDSTSLTAGKSKVNFQPWGYTAVGSGIALTLQREGRASGAEQGEIFEGGLDQSAEESAETVLVEGDVIRVETSVEWTGTVSTSSLVPAWTDEEETAFLRCIHGGADTEADTTTHALIPTTQGSTTDFTTCDGSGSAPLVFVRSPEAVALARESFPAVYRAWKLRHDGITDALTAPGDSSVSVDCPRPILGEQLQFYVRDLSGGTGSDNWLLDRMAIRIEVKNDDGKYVEVPRDINVRVTPDGVLWLDGICEAMDGDRFCIYEGSLYDWKDYITDEMAVRDLRLNLAIPTDTRVGGASSASIAGFDSAMETNFWGLGLMKYVDRPGAYRHDYQYNSTPAASPEFYAGATGTAAPLTRSLPPGSEAPHAAYEAERLNARSKNLRRMTRWGLWGIRNSARAGDWLEKVYLRYTAGDDEFAVGAGIPTVHWDFEKQTTTLGGLLGEYDA